MSTLQLHKWFHLFTDNENVIPILKNDTLTLDFFDTKIDITKCGGNENIYNVSIFSRVTLRTDYSLFDTYQIIIYDMIEFTKNRIACMIKVNDYTYRIFYDTNDNTWLSQYVGFDGMVYDFDDDFDSFSTALSNIINDIHDMKNKKVHITLNQFNELCNDFIDTKINTIDYIGFLHSLLYSALTNYYGTDDNEQFENDYNDLIDFT
jgi:hypothetical protein